MTHGECHKAFIREDPATISFIYNPLVGELTAGNSFPRELSTNVKIVNEEMGGRVFKEFITNKNRTSKAYVVADYIKETVEGNNL